MRSNDKKVCSGIVQKGIRRGTQLGFPTANIPFSDDGISGIYAARVKYSGIEYKGAAFVDPSRATLEVYILDFSEDLYGKELEIVLEKKIRESRPFTDDAKLRATIAADVRAVRDYYA